MPESAKHQIFLSVAIYCVNYFSMWTLVLTTQFYCLLSRVFLDHKTLIIHSYANTLFIYCLMMSEAHLERRNDW